MSKNLYGYTNQNQSIDANKFIFKSSPEQIWTADPYIISVVL